MPYKNPDQKRAADRAYQQKRADTEHPSRPFPVERRATTRLRTTYDVLDRIELHLAAVEEDDALSTATRTRCAGELLRTALKGVEITDLAGRLKRLEELLKQRGLSLPVTAPAQAQDENDTETETIQ